MVAIHWEEKSILLTKSLQKIILDLANDPNFSGEGEVEVSLPQRKKNYYYKKKIDF